MKSERIMNCGIFVTHPPTVEIKGDPPQWKLGFDIGCESVHTSSGNKEKIK